MLYFLIGFMGSGKSHWGRHWAETFGLEFYDLDQVIEQQEGKTIRQIFEGEGETAFRRKESKALETLFRKQHAIIACGGGTPCFHKNMKRMNGKGTTIFLKTSVPVLVERLLPELGHRPVLSHTNADTLPAFIEGKLAERAPFYSKSIFQFNTQYLTDENFKKILDKCKKLSS
jgi:shikimate kinase